MFRKILLALAPLVLSLNSFAAEVPNCFAGGVKPGYKPDMFRVSFLTDDVTSRQYSKVISGFSLSLGLKTQLPDAISPFGHDAEDYLISFTTCVNRSEPQFRGVPADQFEKIVRGELQQILDASPNIKMYCLKQDDAAQCE